MVTTITKYGPDELINKRILAFIGDENITDYKVVEFSPDNIYICVSALPICPQAVLYRHWCAFSEIDVKCILPDKEINFDDELTRNNDTDGVA